MPNRAAPTAVAAVLFVLVGLAWWFLRGDDAPPLPTGADATAAADATPATGALATETAAAAGATPDAVRAQIAGGIPATGVRGIVLDAATGAPLGGVDVVAIRDQPSLEPLVARFRGLFQQGMFVETRTERRELGRTVSNADGTFEITGLPPGRVFLDGHSDAWFVRTPGTARLADGEVAEGVELRAVPGGRVRGIVLGPDGAPMPGAHVSLRPGLNSFLGQITDRQYRWLETTAGDDGRFDLPGVPPGQGYTATAAADQMALEEQHGVAVRIGQVTELTLRGHAGAFVAGRVVDPEGAPVANANVAMVYLDISRVLFSADGRQAPIATDAEGRFAVAHVAAGRVAFVAAADDLAPSQVEELAVVDGGRYEDLLLQLGEGAVIRGRVVDDRRQPIAGAAVELRPFERPNDPQFLKAMLQIRRVVTTTEADGTFVARGLTGERLIVQASAPGHTTAMRFGVKLDEADLVVELQRGSVVRGKVLVGDAPLPRFRVDTRTTAVAAEAAAGGAGARTDGNSGPTWTDDDAPRWGPGRRGMREGTIQLPEGQTMLDRGMNGMDGNWREVRSADGTFELRGIPPGRVRVRVRADGCTDPANAEVELAPGQRSDELVFVLAPGQPVVGTVVDDRGQPVSDAQVTAYRQRDGGERRGPFAFRIDPEDFDFLGLSSAQGRRSAISDSTGAFTIAALEPGRYRLTARHPDLAKSSTTDVEVTADRPTPPVEIRLDAGGGVEGLVTGFGMRPLPDALVVAFSLQAGSMRSSTTDASGFYRIDGLPPGQYVVFKSRLDERADNIPLELMSNMRLKTVTVRQGEFTRADVHDESEDGVRVYGIVRENGAAVPRALVTLMGADRDGILGMGVRAAAAGMDGRYELIGIRPGSYVIQVSRFQGQPVQTTFELEVPADARDFAFDIALPTSTIRGRVLDTRGRPVERLPITLGSDDGALGAAEGLVGLIAQNGLGRARTDADGAFTVRSVAPGTYRLTAGSRLAGGRARRGAGSATEAYGEAVIEGVAVDGVTDVEGLLITVPLAGRIAGRVVDGSGQPVAGAEIAYVETSAQRRRTGSNPMLDLLGAQPRPIRSGDDGRFTIPGLTPGDYDLRVEGDALDAGVARDVRVAEDAEVDVTLTMVRGATLRLRATNVDRERIPFAQLSLLDGQGKPVVRRVSTLTVMRRLLGSRDEVGDSGWYEFGSVPPDTYTIVVAEPGEPELRITRTIRDGETVEWDVDVAAELAARDAADK